MNSATSWSGTGSNCTPYRVAGNLGPIRNEALRMGLNGLRPGETR